MKGKQQQDFRTEKYIRYGIRKYSFGAASVAIAAGLMFLGNGAVSATEVQNAETAISAAAPSQDEDKEKAAAKAETVETEKAVEAKPEVKAVETKKVNKAILEASIATLESKLSTAKYADATVVSSAKEVLATAKATLAKEDASQADVDAQAETVSALSTVVTESNTAGFDKNQAAEKEAAKTEAEKKATPVEKALSVATATLTQVSSEAEVTNKLAETELAKADVKEENKAAVTAAVAKNQAVLTETKALLADKSVTKEQVDAQLERLNESILAVYNELKNAGIGRDGKFSVNLDEVQTTGLKDASTETGTKWLEDHGYKTLADVPVKTIENDRDEITKLNDQIQWLNFSDKSAWSGLNTNGQLQVGAKFTKTLVPGYVVTLTVKELKPFESTEVYKNRVAGTAYQNSYNPDKENKFNTDNKITGLGANPQNNYTHVRKAGINTGSEKTTIAGTNAAGQFKNGQAAGVKFTVEATYNGKPVKPGVVMTSGEDIGPLESEIYTTNGTPWTLAAVVGYGSNKNAYVPLTNFNGVNGHKNMVLWNDQATVNAISGKMFATRDGATAGLGSQVFGGYRNDNGSKAATPIVSSSNVSEVGFYIVTSGAQSSMLGIKFSDFGDLPESYGDAEHFLRTETTDWNTKAIRQIQQPYLGTEKADIDSGPGKRVRGIGSDDQNDNPDEGVKQLIDLADVHNNVDTGEPEVKLVKAPDNTYEVNITASVNGNEKFTDRTETAYVRGFIDFNQNGKFDADEASEIVEVTENNQKVKLKFRNTQIIDTTKEAVNFRVRIATTKSQVEKPVGIAYSGEVEDNQIQVAHPPRGDKEETTGKQGETQSVGIEFRTRPLGDDASDLGSNNGKTTFNSYSKIHYSEQSNVISAETTKKAQGGVKIVDGDNLVDTLKVPGQGTYTVTEDKVTFTPEANFVGKADGIVLRAVDSNGASTGWTALTDQNQLENINDGTHTTTKKTMDAVYIPTVTPKEITAEPKTSKDVQGKAQKETPVFKTDAGTDNEAVITPSTTSPAKLIDPVTKVPTDAKTVTVDGEGTYTINPETGEVTFQPLPTFTGKAKGIGVSLTAPVGVDKTGAKVTSTATTTYTPEVTPVKPTAEPATSTGLQGETQTGKPTFTEGDAEVPIKAGSVKLLNANGTEAQGAVPALDPNGNKVGEYTVDATTGVVTFTPTNKAYVGPVVPAKVQAEDNNGTKVETKYTPSIVGVKPTATPAESSNIQGEAQSGTVTFAPGKATIEGVEKSVAIKEGSAKLLNADGSVPTEATVPAYKEDGVTQVGTYSIDPATNTVTFTPTDKTYTGKVLPANVQAEDVNGSTVKTTYTPHIVGVAPTADPATSTDVQGAVQSKEVTFVPGKTNVNGTEKSVAIDSTSFKLLGENGQPAPSVPAKNPAGEEIGTYTLNVVDGKPTVVLTPTNKAYSGAVKPVTVQAADTNGTTVTTTYTPTITPIKPTGTPVTTEGIQGAEQSGTPTFTQGSDKVPMKIDADQPAKLVDPATGNPTNETTIPAKDETGKQVGTYTIKPTTGEVTFTPNKDFKGTPVPATVEAKDANGTPATAKYTPTVKPATPTGTDAVTEDVQGATQEGTPVFTTGKATVNGTEVEVPLDNKVPAKLVDPATKQPTDEKSVTVPNEGTYTIDENGKVTFTPEKTFTGKTAGIDVRRVDTNGTPVTAKYTPVVKPATPTSSDVVTTNVQGVTQEGTPTFTGGKVTINGQEKTVKIDEAVKPKFDDETTTKTVSGEGTYTIDETGKVTFKPEPKFTGQATGVTVKRVDTNGTPVTAKYTPVVIPVSPTSKDAESEGPKGQSQEGTPTFTGGKVTLNGKEVPVEIDEAVKPKFDDETTTKTVSGEGTYTIDENGKVTFTPEPNFVGKATGVTVKRVDKNGTPVTAKYTPTVRPDTRYVVIEKDGKETDLLPSKDGAKPSEKIPGYNVVKTEIDEKGNIKHIYEKVKTSFKDKEGNEIPKYPSEPGTVDKKDIPEYRFVETKKLPNGDTEHIYERVVAPTPTPTPTPTPFEYKVITTFVDENGVLIIPDENGSHPGKPLENYELVRTETDANGNVRNVYRKIQSQKPVQPVEPATPAMPEQPAKPEVPATPVQPTAVKEAEGKRELPNTGTEDNASLAALGLLGVLSGFGLVARKKKED